MSKLIDQPRVSVVIPTYNRANEMRRCLNSLKKQTIDDFEVLICDDGSSDETSGIVKEYSSSLDITYDYAENFGGPARPRNRGINLARAPYIAFLDSDDWWMPKKLEISVRYLDRGYDVCFHDLWGVKHEKKQVFKKRMKGKLVSRPAYADLINKGNTMFNSSVVVRTELLRQIGGQSEDPNLIAAEDYDCWLRISRVTERFVYIPMALGYYWMGGGNISNAKRSLLYLERLRSLHIAPYMEGHHSNPPIWWEYSFARAMYLTGEKAETRRILEQLVKRSVPWFMRLKVYFMLMTTWKYIRIK